MRYLKLDINHDYGVEKHNHPVDRSNIYDDKRHCDDDADDDVLGSLIVFLDHKL